MNKIECAVRCLAGAGTRPRFVIFGQSRCGSTLLQSLMNSQPEIECHGELLNPDTGYLRSPALLAMVRRFPGLYLNYRCLRSDSNAYGFKLMFYHVSKPGDVLRSLTSSGWHVLHIVRENVLEQSLSKLLARETKRFHRHNSESLSQPKVNIPVESLLQELDLRRRWRETENAAIENIPHMRLSYERDLENSDRWQHTVSRICTELGTACDTAPQTNLVRTHGARKADVIENYSELMSALEATEFSGYIRE